MKIKIFVGVIALGIIAIGIGIYQFNKKVPGLEDLEPDYFMTADELFDAFDTNESEAMAMYSGKVISVVGRVVNVKTDEKQTNITLAAENSMIGGVNCSFNFKVENLSKEDEVTIKGRCQGILMDVVLNNCIQTTTE